MFLSWASLLARDDVVPDSLVLPQRTAGPIMTPWIRASRQRAHSPDSRQLGLHNPANTPWLDAARHSDVLIVSGKHPSITRSGFYVRGSAGLKPIRTMGVGPKDRAC